MLELLRTLGADPVIVGMPFPHRRRGTMLDAVADLVALAE